MNIFTLFCLESTVLSVLLIQKTFLCLMKTFRNEVMHFEMNNCWVIQVTLFIQNIFLKDKLISHYSKFHANPVMHSQISVKNLLCVNSYSLGKPNDNSFMKFCNPIIPTYYETEISTSHTYGFRLQKVNFISTTCTRKTYSVAGLTYKIYEN